MKNIFILFITLVGLSQITYAQEFGAVANGTLNTFRSSESNDFKPLIGYGAGFYIEETYRQWSFLNEITFQRKGTNEEVNEDIKLKIDSKFIQVKIMFNYHFSEMSESKNSAFVGFGVYSGPRVDNRETFKIGEEEITNTEDITVIGFDAGVLLSVGYKIVTT